MGAGGPISVIIPARNEATFIPRVIHAVRSQRPPDRELEVIVVDDGSTDTTSAAARAAGASVLEAAGGGGNPAAARNQGAAAAKGDPLIFLDADCIPGEGWLKAILEAHCIGVSLTRADVSRVGWRVVGHQLLPQLAPHRLSLLGYGR